MTLNASIIRNKMLESIGILSNSASQYTINPGKDFTRNRTLSFEKTVSIILGMKGGTLSHELLDSFNCSSNICTSSAFIQQRAKIQSSAFAFLFHDFTNAFLSYGKYRNYTLLAADGTDVITGPDPSTIKAFFVESNSKKQYNLYHVNALCNLESSLYTDVHIQTRREFNEHAALATMVDRSPIENAIVIADRGYESYNTIAHIQNKGWKYLIRLKNSQGILKSLDLPNTDEFDVSFNLKLMRKHTNRHKKLALQKNEYKIINSNVNFDYLTEKDDEEFFELPFRVVRFRISDTLVETIITNLPADLFKADELKVLYSKRWGIETSFRELKHIVGMMHFHARKANFVYQEIFAKMLMYNYAKLIVFCASLKRDRQTGYRINFSTAFHICRQLFNNTINPDEAINLILRYLTPIRDGRKYGRTIKTKPPVSFIYRVA